MNTATDPNLIPPIEDFVDSQTPDVDEETQVRARSIPRTPPPQFVVLRGNKFERLQADTWEDAEAKVANQVKIGQTPIVYLFELKAAIMFEPSSKTISPEEIAEALRVPTAAGS